MSAIYLMIPFALLLGFGFVAAFVVMAFRGEYDDLCTPPHRILLDDEPVLDRSGSLIGKPQKKGN